MAPPARTTKSGSGRGRFVLRSERLGPLPLVNHFLGRLGVEEILDKHIPTEDRRVAVRYSTALGVLLRSIIVEREPIYRQQETVQTFLPVAFGLTPLQVPLVGDDRIGRALDRLFDADRAALLTDLVVAVSKRFSLRFDRLHNDSTTYASAASMPAPRDEGSEAGAPQPSPMATPRTTGQISSSSSSP